jgi:hypothetical protein
MSLLDFCEWLGNTPGSVALHESVHVWGLAVFVGFAMTLDLRLLGLAMTRVPMSEVARRVLPWMGVGFAVMVATGVLTFYARPVHYFHNVFFRFKLVLLVLAGLNAWAFHSTIWLKVADWDRDRTTPGRARFAGAASLVLWVSIIVLGRMMAYDWFDCEKQPQPAVINFLTGCVPGIS